MVKLNELLTANDDTFESLGGWAVSVICIARNVIH